MTVHVVQFSTGAGSAEVAYRVHERMTSGDRVVLLTADTSVEDDDNWRFAREVVAVIYLGFDWTEEHRLPQSLPHWTPWKVEAPLMYEPYYTKSQILDRMRERGIEPPRLYAEGFSHANCGGACVRGGQAAWELLLRRRPETFSVWEAEEQLSRTVLGKDISILRDRRGGTTKPLTLQAFRLRLEAKAEFDREDWGSCGCTTEQGELFEFDIMNQGGK